MKVEIRHSMSQRTVQRCTTCDQPIGGAADAELTEAVILCGSERYVVCPTCSQVVPEELRTAAYKAVWTRKNRERASSQPKSGARAATAGEERQSVSPEEWLRERQEFETRVAKSRETHRD